MHVKTVQSPIAISIRESQVRDDVKQLEFHGHSENDGKAFVENTGTSARVKLLQRNKQPYISGGVLRPNERYIFEELHFHWTDTNDAGCEHEINGQTYGFFQILKKIHRFLKPSPILVKKWKNLILSSLTFSHTSDEEVM